MAIVLADEQRMRQLAEDRSLQSDSIGVIYRTLISEFDSDIASDKEQAQLLAMLAAAERIADGMSDLFPQAVAELRLSIGRGYSRLRRHEQAVDQFTKADQLLTESLGPASGSSVFARRGKSMEQAERVPVSSIVSDLERLSAVARRIDGYESQLHATIVVDLGHCYYANRQIDDMLSFYETHYPAIALIALLEPRGIAKIESVWSWGLLELGRFNDASPVLVSLYDRRVQTLGARHRDTLDTGFNLAHAYLGTGKTQEAVGLLEELLKDSEELFHRNPQRYLRVRRMLRRGYYLVGQTTRGLALSQEIFREAHDRFGRSHPETLADEHALALALMQDQQYEAARDRFVYLHKANERNLGSTNLHTISTLSQLARCELALERYDEAIDRYLDTVGRYEALLGPDHIGTFKERRILVATYSEGGRHGEALLQADLLLDDAVRALGKEHPLTAKIAVTMGRSEMKAGQPSRSRKTILKWKDRLADEQWGDAFFLYRTYECLAEASEEMGEPEAAARWAREAARLHEKWKFPLEQQGPSDAGPATGRLPEEG
ncbi:MAG: tetratricopeptide repeat protein [Planctomycetota bacterium]